MVTCNTSQSDNERLLEYIGKHKQAFDIYEDIYPLALFEDFVQEQGKKGAMIATGGKGDKDRLYLTGFGFGFLDNKESQTVPNLHQQLQEFLHFFRQVENRVEVKLNYQLIKQFFGVNPDYQGIIELSIAVDARPEIAESRLKLYIILQNAPKKVETAIALCGDSPTLRAFLVNDMLVVGFDLFFDGRSEIEIYPVITQYELQRADIRSRIIPLLPPRALSLLDKCKYFQVGFSRANESNVLYFDTVFDANSFIDNLGNEMAKKIHAYYRHQPFFSLVVGIPEKDFYAPCIEQVKLSYRYHPNLA
jgi:LynF/TruF/PatF family peptide O-prenyltransferase